MKKRYFIFTVSSLRDANIFKSQKQPKDGFETFEEAETFLLNAQTDNTQNIPGGLSYPDNTFVVLPTYETPKTNG